MLLNKKILLCSHELSFTGAPHSLLRISKILLKNRAKVTVWSLKDGEFRAEFEKLGLAVEIVTAEDLYEDTIIDEIKTFDCAIANTVIANDYFVAINEYIPCIWYVREAKYLPDTTKKCPERLEALLNADEIYCVSQYAKTYIQDFCNTHVKVVHNCVEDYFNNVPNVIGDKINIAILGTINPRKAIDVCLDGFESLSKQMQQNFHLYFAGQLVPTQKSYWEPILERIIANPNTTYLGEIKDTEQKFKFYESMNAVLVISRDESCSLVVLEGAMMGRPMIVSENVGAKYLVNEGCGWIIPTDDIQAVKMVLEDMFEKKISFL